MAESEAREAILEAAPTSEAAAVNLNMLLMVTDLGRTTAQKAIESLLEAGKLRRTGEGVKGSPYRYWRPTSPEDPPDEPPSGGDQMLSAATDTLEGAGNKTDASSELTDGNTDEPLSGSVRHAGSARGRRPTCPAVANVLWRRTDLVKKEE